MVNYVKSSMARRAVGLRVDGTKIRKMLEDKGITQVGLAQSARLSRATIASILSHESHEVRTETARKIADTLGLALCELDKTGTQSAYLEAMRLRNASLDFTGFAVSSFANPMPIDQGFIPIRMAPLGDAGDDRTGCTEMPRSSRAQNMQTFALSDVLNRFPRTYLLGDPCSGKTTALRYIASIYAHNHQNERGFPTEIATPLLVRLADWAELLGRGDQAGLIHAAISQLELAEPIEVSQWLEEQAAGGRLLALLDGLDEVAEPDLRARVIDGIKRFVEEHAEAHMVITSRSVGFVPLDLGVSFDKVEILPLSTLAIRSFISTWRTYRHGHDSHRKCRDCEKRIGALTQSITEMPRIRSLAANPMVLTILLLLQEGGSTLPQRRWDLYEKVIETFLFSWETEKRNASPGVFDRSLRVDDREVLLILEHLALEMQRRNWTLAPRWWLSDTIRSLLQAEIGLRGDEAKEESDVLIRSLHARSGLLIERGPERYGFSHLSFQEYFAARAVVATEDPIGVLAQHLYHPRWREVVRLVAGRLDRTRGTRLLRTILDDPDPTGRFLRRGLLLALSCLADTAGAQDADVLDRMMEETIALGKTKWLGLPLEAMHYLGDLRETRLDWFARKASGEMLAAAKTALTAGEYATLWFGAMTNELVKSPFAEDQSEREGVFRYELPERPGAEVVLISPPKERSEAWLDLLIGRLQKDEPTSIREACGRELGRYVRVSKKAREGLIDALKAEALPQVRAEIVEALGRVANIPDIKAVLVNGMTDCRDADLQGEYAAALRRVAVVDDSLRGQLLSLLETGSHVSVIVGAIRGLRLCAGEFKNVQDILNRLARDEGQPAEVRRQALWSLEEALVGQEEGVDFLTGVLRGGNAKLRRVAAFLLSRYLAQGRIPWSDSLISEIEELLKSLTDPCPCAMDALESLMETRELRRRDIPREVRIWRAIAPFDQRIRVAFVFGSSARGEQRAESDIDLMIIGDVSLRELSPILGKIEEEVGRQVNVVIYSENEWRVKVVEKQPFVLNVRKEPKVFVKGDESELAAVGG